jgi:hypothetical protein
MMGMGQNGEKLMVNSPRLLEHSGRWWFGSVTAASLSERKQLAVVLLNDVLVVVEGMTGSTRFSEAPRLAGWTRDVSKSDGDDDGL